MALMIESEPAIAELPPNTFGFFGDGPAPLWEAILSSAVLAGIFVPIALFVTCLLHFKLPSWPLAFRSIVAALSASACICVIRVYNGLSFGKSFSQAISDSVGLINDNFFFPFLIGASLLGAALIDRRLQSVAGTGEETTE